MSDDSAVLRETANCRYIDTEIGQEPELWEALTLAADVLDAIPGDDKLAVAEWAVKIAAAYVGWADGHANSRDLNNVFFACPPSVRAALRSNGGES